MNTIVFLILHYGDIAVTKSCTDSILQLNTEDNIRIVIVDNDYKKSEAERKQLDNQYADSSIVKIIKMTENVGFSRANNEGYLYAKKHYQPDYIIVTNNDIVFEQKDFIEKIKFDYEQYEYAVLGPDILGYDDGKHQSPIDVQGRTLKQVDYTIWMNKVCLAMFSLVYPLLKWNFGRQKEAQSNTNVGYCEGIVPSGACIVLSSLFIDKESKVFAPETMFYYEEYILHERCRQKGHKIVFEPNVYVVHGDSVATKHKTGNQRERIRFVMKNTLESARVYRDMLSGKKKVKKEKSVSWKGNLRKITVIRLMLNAPLYLKTNGWKKTIQYTQDVIWNFFGKNRNKVPRIQYNVKELEEQGKKDFKKNIKFSIVVPLYNTPISYLREMIESVQNQTYTNWELCLADGSDEGHEDVGDVCHEYQQSDARIKYKKLSENKGISENTNVALEMSEGEYVGLLDHDDCLHLSALFECMCVIEQNKVDYIYTDEMTFVGDIKHVVNVHFKPDFSPDTLRSYNYIGCFSVFNKQLLNEVGNFDPRFEGSQNYDVIFRLTEKAQNIVHIQKVLYFKRLCENSVIQNHHIKSSEVDVTKDIILEHLNRVGLVGKVEVGKIPTIYRIEYEIKQDPLISILIPNKDHVIELRQCIESIESKSTYKNIEIIVVENNSEQEETFAYYESLMKNCRNVKVVNWKGDFNYSAINNYGVTFCKGEYIVLLNNDIEVITPNWLEEMLMFAQRPDVGAVGAMLYYPDDTIQHAGVIVGIGGVAGHSHKFLGRDNYGYANRLLIAQNLSAVTAACMMMRKSIYEEVDGLDEQFKVAYNDVDICMRIHEKGYLNVFTPFAELYHYESKSRGSENTKEKIIRLKKEKEYFVIKWSDYLKVGDPYYNINLTQDKEDFSYKNRRK